MKKMAGYLVVAALAVVVGVEPQSVPIPMF